MQADDNPSRLDEEKGRREYEAACKSDDPHALAKASDDAKTWAITEMIEMVSEHLDIPEQKIYQISEEAGLRVASIMAKMDAVARMAIKAVGKENVPSTIEETLDLMPEDVRKNEPVRDIDDYVQSMKMAIETEDNPRVLRHLVAVGGLGLSPFESMPVRFFAIGAVLSIVSMCEYARLRRAHGGIGFTPKDFN